VAGSAPHGRRGPGARLEPQHQQRQPARLGFDYPRKMIDDPSRLASAESHDDRGETAAAVTARAVAWFAARGVTIERVMTDNGSCYRLRPFRGVLAGHGVVHKRTRPYRPQTNGKVQPAALDADARVGLRRRLHLQPAAPRGVRPLPALRQLPSTP
jgi:transposase InsO family protein